MYGQLGNIKFEGLKGFSSLSESSATNYAEIGRVNRKPSLQRVGERLRAISLSILLHADFSDVERDYEELDKAREQADSLPFILGNGRVLGDFYITTLRRQLRKTAPDGSIIYLTADLELKESNIGERRELLSATARQNAFANSTDKIIPTIEVSVLPSTGVEAGGLSVDVDIQASRIAANVEEAQTNTSARPDLYSNLVFRTDTVSILALELANKVREAQSQISNAQTIINNAESLRLFSASLRQAAINADINEINAANTTFQDSARRLQESCSSLVRLIAARKI